MAFVKRVAQLGFDSAGYFHKSPPAVNLSPSSLAYRFGISKLVKVRGLEAKGVPSEQANGITTAIADIVQHVSQSFVSKAKMQKIEMIQDSKLLEVQIAVSKEHHFSLLQRKIERLRSDIEKMGSELRDEIDKVRTGQPLVLNNEKGQCIHDVIAKQHAELTDMRNKLDQGMEALKAKLDEVMKDMMKYCIGIMAVSAVVIVFSVFYRFVL